MEKVNFICRAGVLLPVVEEVEGAKFWVILAGQTVIGLAQPFYLFSVTKLTSALFAPGERAFANTIASLFQYVQKLVL